MTTHRILALVAATSLALPGLAMAQAAPDPAPAHEFVGLAAAVEAAVEGRGGGVLDAELEVEDGRAVYEVEIARDGAVHEAVVDARTGEVLSVAEHRVEGALLGWFDAERLRAAEAAGAGLGAALAAAEAELGGPVIEASLEEADGSLYYEVEVATPAGEREAVVDPATGAVVPGDLDD